MSPAVQGSTQDTRLIELLEGCAQIFRRIGVRAVSMEDIARELGVSKKTLYKYCKDKADLVLQVFDPMCNRQDARI